MILGGGDLTSISLKRKLWFMEVQQLNQGHPERDTARVSGSSVEPPGFQYSVCFWKARQPGRYYSPVR